MYYCSITLINRETGLESCYAVHRVIFNYNTDIYDTFVTRASFIANANIVSRKRFIITDIHHYVIFASYAKCLYEIAHLSDKICQFRLASNNLIVIRDIKSRQQ